MPGVIDLHGGELERHIAPRPSAPFPIETGLMATDRDAAANGITTAWMAQSWSWEGGHRSPEFAEQFLQAVEKFRPRMCTDLRVQLRCETHTVNTRDHLLRVIGRYGVDYVIFNDHLEEALQMANAKPHDLAMWASKSGRSVQEHLALVHQARDQSRDVPRYLCKLAESFDQRGVTYGSHDDPDGDTRETYSLIGAKVCEFPTARAPAALAKAVNDPVLMGAPNIVRGGSQSGNIAAMELVESALCDALVSEYYYPSLAHAAFHISDQGVLPLERAWNLISANPPQILRLPDRGAIEFGKRADLTIINAVTRAIEATITAGRITHMAGGAAHRFMATKGALPMAAE